MDFTKLIINGIIFAIIVGILYLGFYFKKK